MNLVLARDLKKLPNGSNYPKISTIYKWHCLKKHPELIFKMPNGVFFDLDTWEQIAQQAKMQNIKQSDNVKNIKGL